MSKILKDAKGLTDFEIIEEVLDGGTDLFEEIIRRYNAPLYKIGRSYNINHQDTQDLFNRTLTFDSLISKREAVSATLNPITSLNEKTIL